MTIPQMRAGNRIAYTVGDKSANDHGSNVPRDSRQLAIPAFTNLERRLPPLNYLARNFSGLFLAGSSFSSFFVLSHPVRAYIGLYSRFRLPLQVDPQLDAYIILLFSSYVKEIG